MVFGMAALPREIIFASSDDFKDVSFWLCMRAIFFKLTRRPSVDLLSKFPKLL
jgi:hypothetical protein